MSFGYGDSVWHGDTWKFCLITFRWTRIELEVEPAVRSCPYYGYADGIVTVFSGFNGYSCLDCVWQFDCHTERWTKRTTPRTLSGRYFGAACIHDRKMYIVGGFD